MERRFYNLIPQKSKDIEIGQFNDSEDYIITQKKLGNRIVVNKKTIDVLNLIDGKRTLYEIVCLYNSTCMSSLRVDVAYKLLYERLGKQGVILNEQLRLKKKEIATYLALSFTLVDKTKLVFITKLISPIICFKYFYTIILLSFIIISTTLFINYDRISEHIDNISVKYFIAYILSSGFILFMHEFGHATACKKLGAEPGDIGFGFYLLSPVMFTDVSDIWKLKRRERIYVNFAGLYIEIIIGFFLNLAFLITNYPPILILCLIIFFNFLLNLNPFLRYDGYWILSDITNTPNMRKLSLQKLNLFISSILNKSKVVFNSKDIFLIIYAICSMVLIFVFLAFIIFNDPNSILLFPKEFYSYIKSVAIEGSNFQLSETFQFILPILFYFTLIKLIFNFLTRFKVENNGLL